MGVGVPVAVSDGVPVGVGVPVVVSEGVPVGVGVSVGVGEGNRAEGTNICSGSEEIVSVIAACASIRP